MQVLILITIFLTVILIFIVAVYLYILNKKVKQVIDKKEIYNENDEILMIRYNYVINLKKIDAFTKQLLNYKVDKNLIEYIKSYNQTIENDIYNTKTYNKTINFENDILYKTEIINLDIIFYAYKHLFDTLDNNYYEILNDKSLRRVEILKKEKLFNKKISNLRKKSELIIREKNNVNKYYQDIEEIKSHYKQYIDKLNPLFTLLFINHGVDVISEKDNIN